MNGLLGTNDSTEEMRKIWHDGIKVCKLPLERIAYDDFLMLMKGQAKDREPLGRVSKLRTSRQLISPPASPALLEAVPEGSVSPQGKAKTFVIFDGMPMLSLESLDMPTLSPRVETPADIAFPLDLDKPMAPYRRTRSRSMGEIKNAAYDFGDDEEAPSTPRTSNFVVVPSRTKDELGQLIKDKSKTPLVVNRALYRKNRELRFAVMDASKEFDLKRQARKMQFTSKRGALSPSAGLVMRRGGSVPSPVPHPRSESGHVTNVLLSTKSEQVHEASRKSGRPRRVRKKTLSDISGML
jgi:hypothetical protein